VASWEIHGNPSVGLLLVKHIELNGGFSSKPRVITRGISHVYNDKAIIVPFLSQYIAII
jgi:hypothetical protein